MNNNHFIQKVWFSIIAVFLCQNVFTQSYQILNDGNIKYAENADQNIDTFRAHTSDSVIIKIELAKIPDYLTLADSPNIQKKKLKPTIVLLLCR